LKLEIEADCGGVNNFLSDTFRPSVDFDFFYPTIYFDRRSSVFSTKFISNFRIFL